ncbi:MAG: hypothetical protein JKY56_24595 [Kofleriaceae bacterium]|nr:hypothetical protein [Kofleriaceae bacterium]
MTAVRNLSISLVASLLVVSSGCETAKDTPTGDDATAKKIYDGLRPTCGGCHGENTNFPIFASATAFQVLILQDPSWVVPGAPEESEFVKILRGEATGQFSQMPLTGDNFATLAADGKTAISVDEIEELIRNLDEQPSLPVESDRSLPTVARKSGDQLLRSLKTQVGLSEDVFFNEEHSGATSGRFAVLDPDRSPMRNPGYGEIPKSIERYIRLGGHSYLEGRRGNTEINPAFVQSLVVLSQTYCRLGITRGDGVLSEATLADVSSDPAGLSKIESNIEYLYLRMLGMLAKEQDKSELLGLFQHYETESSTEDAWTAVCSAIVRDPRWLSL